MLKQVLTVSALNRLARETLQQNFPLLWVRGELCNLSRAASGHVYFSLKDEAAQVRCVMFRNRAQLLPWRLENGQQVEAQVLVTLYEARGDYQLNVEALDRAGLGALYEAYARLREKLEREGLFASDRKRPMPRFPRRVGIVTSLQAAALQDVLSVLKRRAAHLSLIIYSAPVQGAGAGEKITAAIMLAGQRRAIDAVDVLLVVRGGGSLEDLSAFNEEAVARAIAASPIPVVTGVGHESDTTIADFAADQRAATPSAAAELVSAGWFAATHELAALAGGLQRSLRFHIEARVQALDILSRRLLHPGTRLARDRHALAHLTTRLHASFARHLRRHAVALERVRASLTRSRPVPQASHARLVLAQQQLAAACRKLLARHGSRLDALGAGLSQLSPQATLERGYAVVYDEAGQVLRTSAEMAVGDRIALRFAVGRARAQVTETDALDDIGIGSQGVPD